MADFPTTDPSFTDLDGQQTLAANNHAARHNKVHREVEAIAERVGTTGDTDPDSHEKKIADLESTKADISYVDGEIDGLDSDLQAFISSSIATAVASTKEALYPVGSLYYNATDGTDPATLLGFGTWIPYAVGRVPVGIDPLDTDFDTAGETGGAKTSRHSFMDMAMNSNNFQDGGTNYRNSAKGDIDSWLTGGGSSVITRTSTVRNVAGTVGTNGTSATEVGHWRYTAPTLQPYVALYIWQRTA